MVSFSKIVKDELIKIKTKESKVRLIAIIMSLGNIQFSYDHIILEIKTSNISLIRETLKLLKSLYPEFDEQVIIRESKKFKKKNKLYIIKIQKMSKDILLDLQLINNKQTGLFFQFDIPKIIFKNDYTKKEYLRYLFISNGSINDPKIQKQYHLEIIFNNIEALEIAKDISKKYDINFKKTTRKNVSALYLNKGEEIVDFLKLIGSIDNMFDFENQRLIRDMRATANRMINAEIANETKKQTASMKQIDAINKIKESGRFYELKSKTQMVAQLRLDNPDLSLNELVEESKKTISKSNLRYHLTILIKEAEDIN